MQDDDQDEIVKKLYTKGIIYPNFFEMISKMKHLRNLLVN